MFPLAYLDPASGAAFIQAIIAAVATSMVFLKLYWHKLMSFFKSSKPNNPTETDSPHNP